VPDSPCLIITSPILYLSSSTASITYAITIIILFIKFILHILNWERCLKKIKNNLLQLFEADVCVSNEKF
jgi:uncharacterized membrane protein